MNISPEGVAKIRDHEGCVLHVYNDQAGLPTIGVGHLIVPGESYPGGVITQALADELLAQDLERTVQGVNECLAVEVTQAQFDALVSLAFNIGVGALKKSSVIRAINQKLPNDVIRERLCRWDKITRNGRKEVSPGLAKRRAEEAKAWP